MNLIEAEEEKLKDKTRWDFEREMRSRELNYEEYYQNYIQKSVEVFQDTKDTWLQDYNSEYLFDQDITNAFFESDKEREYRIRETWLKIRKSNIEQSSDARTTEEQNLLQEDIVEWIRKLRWKIDQEFVGFGFEPVFKYNYRRYTQREFMADADI